MKWSQGPDSGSGRLVRTSENLSRETSKMNRETELENNLLDIVNVRKRERKALHQVSAISMILAAAEWRVRVFVCPQGHCAYVT